MFSVAADASISDARSDPQASRSLHKLSLRSHVGGISALLYSLSAGINRRSLGVWRGPTETQCFAVGGGNQQVSELGVHVAFRICDQCWSTESGGLQTSFDASAFR